LLGARQHLELLKADVLTHERTRQLAAQYNSKEPPKRVAVLGASLLELFRGDGAVNGVYFLEHYLLGQFEKHSSNFGFVGRQLEAEPAPESGDTAHTRVGVLQRASLLRNPRQTPHSFSYFSWHASGGREVVADVQGVGDIYTDPQIHSLDAGAGGAGNLGLRGIVAFLSTHLSASSRGD
jgi:elongation factor 2 kinase